MLLLLLQLKLVTKAKPCVLKSLDAWVAVLLCIFAAL
jgi:hypothetical protein